MANEPKDIAMYKGDNIRDKKLVEATSADTVGSGDSVVLKTTSGDYVEIDRDSFADEIRKVMGGLIKNNDKGTSISGITVTDANNDLGSVTLSNLASVLAIPKDYQITTLGCGYSFDSYSASEGIFFYSINHADCGGGGAWGDYPSSVLKGTCIIKKDTNKGIAFCFSASSFSIRIKNNGSWGGWITYF